MTLDIPIIFEDDDILVINKPAGITVHEAPGETDVTLNELFSDRFQEENTTGRDMIVHRLDKGTSGVMALAKNAESAENLKKQFHEREVSKVYLTLVKGHLDSRKGTIDIPLARDERNREKISANEEGKPAVTDFEVITEYPSFTYLKAFPKTGRTHQIRTHFSMIGHPIYGDKRYGGPTADRIFLHAHELSFKHPKTGDVLKYNSELPKELQEVLNSL